MVSRRHCLILEDKGTIRLQDLGSLNGTYTGPDRIMDAVLEDGNEFMIGNIRFVFNPDETLKSPVTPEVRDPVVAATGIILNPGNDLLPPLPLHVGKQTSPSFIKPLVPLSLSLDDEENDIIGLNEVIDLADVADKKASTPPPLREHK
jgi:pSer/pThr/pTyr-binding forkhead associated (FHA) protein